VFGITWAIDAVLKWLPGYRNTFLSQLKGAAQGQPSWLHWWFHGWISIQSHAPSLFADLTGLAETTLAVVLLLGVARRAGYVFGIVYTLLVWSVGEGFGGPYVSGSTDIGTGIILAIMFAALYVTAPSAADGRLGLDRTLITRWSWWKLVAEPHAADRS
jgi:nitrite reductase (NO-forming)